MTDPLQPIQPSLYSEDYFLSECDGHEEYMASGGIAMAQRLQMLRKLLGVSPGMQIVDVGCGRGELLVSFGLDGAGAVGIDYSQDGLCLAQRAAGRAKDLGRKGWVSPHLALANAKELPFRDATFDRALMSDIVEHLYPEELATALAEVHRVLKPGGELLVHTMPNLWYYRYGYPLFRAVARVRGEALPADPRDRFPFSHLHVNEQTPRTLREALAESPFRDCRVWLHDYRKYMAYSLIMRISMRLLTGLPLVKLIFCDDIFAWCRK